ncbi:MULTISPECIES: amino-acid N-acetyltransferase [Thiomicrorhabdus]|uniref:Amino-acid acetyltransferase n=1 Tax=Thiomicrorhabdus heinhorstiae TaxID=2748010 RepID=A0ABS0C3W2_9GAMM|nr:MULTISPECIES: amino-acid N-acetyltransferase [Thiomicrorhabdus]MBF6058831.1 amino-acid N-acetyltransferase [Thiomicrorhabdus heinhorstiae]
MQQSELDFINTLRQSSRYIEEHRGKTCVIYLPGTLLAAPDSLKQLGSDIGLLHHLGLKIVLVMGATQQIDSALNRAGVEWQTHRDVRITSIEMLDIFQQTIGQVRSQLEAVFSQASALLSNPVTIVSGNWVIAQPKGVIDGIDFQHTGKLRKIDHKGISACLDSGQIVLLTPLAYSLTGEVFNLNTLEQTCEVANALKADKLMIYAKPEQLQKLPKQMSIPELRQLIKQLEDSEQKHLLQQIDLSNQFIKRVHILDERDPSALLMELFSRDGCGTLIFSDRYHQLRPAHIEDVGGILELISPLEEQGVLVKRSRERLELEIENFLLLERDQTIIGCAAIYPHENNMGELACLAVHADYRGQELGEQLLKAIEVKALKQGIESLFLLTTHTHHWFIEHGFSLKTVEDLPSERQSLYNLKRQSKVLIKPLSTDN